jgi:CMP/dCMP kinase
MSDKQDDVSAMRAITISRQYGSGGGEIAARLAQRLGWQLIDHEIVAQVAHELGITAEEAEARDERVEGFIARVLSTFQHAAPAALVPAVVPPVSADFEEQAYREALRRVVETAANTGHAVIVGRAGQVLLAARHDVLHVRIVAPPQQRIAYVARREGLDEATAHLRLQLKDRDRARYLQMQHHHSVDDPLLYDLVLNTGILDLDSAVDLICMALERKAQRLSVPTGELGPAAGLAPYPGRPADLRPPISLTEKEASS